MLPGLAKPFTIDPMLGNLYLIPCGLNEQQPHILLPSYLTTLNTLRHFVVENIRTSRRFLRANLPAFDIDHCQFWEIDKHDANQHFEDPLRALKQGFSVGLLSEAGCPGIADPGAKLVWLCHQHHIIVKPWIGPSSILLALMSSGMNGQSFCFHGYLPSKSPSELIKKIKELEATSLKQQNTHIFIETPYRNESLFGVLKKNLASDTLLCLATDLTGPFENITTMTVREWQSQQPNLAKIPTVFLIYCPR